MRCLSQGINPKSVVDQSENSAAQPTAAALAYVGLDTGEMTHGNKESK
jgi:hypothetical protein